MKAMIFPHRIFARLFLLGGFAAITGFAADAPWTSLFTGGDLSGWTLEGLAADKDKGVVTVQDGAIWVHAVKPDKICKDHVWLVTKKEYSDFVLRMKFQEVRGDRGNSGIQIRSRIDADSGMQGLQLDVNPPGPWRTGMLYDMTVGVTRFLSPEGSTEEVKKEMAVPGLIHYYADEGPGWNEIEITAIGSHIKCVLNGVTVMDFVDSKNVLNDAVHQKYNVGVKGFIALQIHEGRPVDLKFKEIEIQDLAQSGK